MDDNNTIHIISDNIMNNEITKTTIRLLIVKSWNQTIINESNINIPEKIEETKVIFGELLSNYVATNYDYGDVITNDNKSIISNIIISKSYNLWLKNLIHLHKKNNYILNEDDVIANDFPNNKWVEVDFN